MGKPKNDEPQRTPGCATQAELQLIIMALDRASRDIQRIGGGRERLRDKMARRPGPRPRPKHPPGTNREQRRAAKRRPPKRPRRPRRPRGGSSRA